MRQPQSTLSFQNGDLKPSSQPVHPKDMLAARMLLVQVPMGRSPPLHRDQQVFPLCMFPPKWVTARNWRNTQVRWGRGETGRFIYRVHLLTDKYLVQLLDPKKVST